jgi:Sec-independent protein translocase protein TatA
MGSDLAIVLIVVLVIVLIWRGPKTLPLLGRAFGQGVKEARKEIEGVKDDSAATETGTTETGTTETAATDETKPPQP